MAEDTYTHGHGESVLRAHRRRSAADSAAYLLPRITPDARILDVGCGPGTITTDLARLAPQGSVVGVDVSAAVVGEAADTARTAGVPNVEFTVGSAYDLAHEDASFDVVHAHQLLQHLSDPVGALREMGRVCRPGGTVAVRDSDYAAFSWWPAVPELDEWLGLYRTVARGNGAEPDAGRRLKSWALAAGLKVATSTASVWCYSTPVEVTWWGEVWAQRIVGSAVAEQARSRDLATPDDLARLARGWRRWAAAPDAWFVLVHGELLCTP